MGTEGKGRMGREKREEVGRSRKEEEGRRNKEGRPELTKGRDGPRSSHVWTVYPKIGCKDFF
jgi:hypothetical protein